MSRFIRVSEGTLRGLMYDVVELSVSVDVEVYQGLGGKL